MRPHRGPLVLVLGILGLVLCGVFTAIPAWIMGHRDLKDMDAGRMDSSGRSMTTAGRILGMIGTILGIIGTVIVTVLVVVGVLTGAMRSDSFRKKSNDQPQPSRPVPPSTTPPSTTTRSGEPSITRYPGRQSAYEIGLGQRMRQLADKHGSNQIAMVRFIDLPRAINRAELYRDLRAVAKPQDASMMASNNEVTIFLAPVVDLEALAGRIPIGKVTHVDPAARTITVMPPPP